jgi:Flp pilus assembly protein CpaB
MSCLIGLITASVYASKIRHLRDEIISFSEKVSVMTVSRSIRAGEVIVKEDLSNKLVLKENVSGRTISPEDMTLIVGRQVIHPVPANDPILWTDFPEGPRVRYPSEKIPPGYRMMALPADEIHTLIHFITPGDRVDIVSSAFENSGNRLVSQLIAKSIVVLGVGRKLEGRTNGDEISDYPLSVSILVRPETALSILHASQIGEIHFLAQGLDPLSKGKGHTGRAIPTTSLSGENP